MAGFDELKRLAFEANMLLPEYRLIDLTFGNLSVVDRAAGVFAIKPSGVPYEDLRVEQMVIVDLEGTKVEGDLNPSSDTPTHACLYRGFAGIGAVVHTHSRYATSFAQAGRGIPCFGTTHCDYFYGEIPITREMKAEEIQGAYELETGNVIVERFEGIDPMDYPGVLVRSHAPFGWGKTGVKAVENLLAMEVIAQMAFQTLTINPGAQPVAQALLDKHFLRKHGKGAYYGQSGGC